MPDQVGQDGDGRTGRVIIRQKKRSKQRFDLLPYVLKELLLLCVSLVELINTTCGVNELHLTCVEWVRCVRDLELYNRVLNALDFDGLLGVRA